MLVMPYNHDQPDNASRIARLGVGRTLSRKRYNGSRVFNELREILDNPAYATRAAKLGEIVRSENGTSAACDEIEEGHRKQDTRHQES